MLSRATDDLGNCLESVTVRFKILPEFNTIHVKEVLKMLEKSVDHLTYYKKSAYSTFETDSGMNLLDLSSIPESKVDEAKLVIEATLLNLKNLGAVDSYKVS